jgi:hypothetical protein
MGPACTCPRASEEGVNRRHTYRYTQVVNERTPMVVGFRSEVGPDFAIVTTTSSLIQPLVSYTRSQFSLLRQSLLLLIPPSFLLRRLMLPKILGHLTNTTLCEHLLQII